MKKFLFLLSILLIGSIGTITKAADRYDYFNSNREPLSGNSYQNLLNECDNTWGYSFDNPVNAVVFSNTDKDGFIFSKSFYDSFGKVSIYRLFMSPYPIEYIKSGGVVDISKFIIKEPEFRDSEEYDIVFYISSDDVDLNTTYYGFIVPVNEYDEVGTPAAEIIFNINQGIAQYDQEENLCITSVNKYLNTKSITLEPGLNTFSTPAILKSISFSNGGSNIYFANMEKGKRKAISINNNISEVVSPLNGYIIKNMNTYDVIMTIEYDTDNSNALILSKDLDAGWNFLGITSIDNPFDNISNVVVTMKKDLTDGGTSNLIQLGKTFFDATKYVLGKAYAVFITSSNGIYGGVNNYSNETENNLGNSYPHDIYEAYEWAYSNGIIFESNIIEAGMYNKLPNPVMRAILLNFANYLGLDTNSIAESFGDLFIDEGSYANRASFGTALSKILWNNQYDGGNPYYEYHLNALKSSEIMVDIDNPEEKEEIKGYVLLMLMKASALYDIDRINCNDPVVILACEANSDSCPNACKTDCNDPLVVLACEDNSDACPNACKTDCNDPLVVLACEDNSDACPNACKTQ